MTMQISDTVDYMGELYKINDIENRNLLPKIEDFGLIATMISTACYRGYVINYKVTDHLFIDSIIVKAENGIYPLINNTVAESYTDSHIWRSAYIYRNTDLSINYSGHILICKGFDNHDYLDSGLMLNFRRNRSVTIQYYSNVIELGFSNGNLISCKDLSDQNNRLKDLIQKNIQLFKGKPSVCERVSDDILLTAFGDYEWWMHREITADMKQAESDLSRIVK